MLENRVQSGGEDATSPAPPPNSKQLHYPSRFPPGDQSAASSSNYGPVYSLEDQRPAETSRSRNQKSRSHSRGCKYKLTIGGGSCEGDAISVFIWWCFGGSALQLLSSGLAGSTLNQSCSHHYYLTHKVTFLYDQTHEAPLYIKSCFHALNH